MNVLTVHRNLQKFGYQWRGLIDLVGDFSPQEPLIAISLTERMNSWMFPGNGGTMGDWEHAPSPL